MEMLHRIMRLFRSGNREVIARIGRLEDLIIKQTEIIIMATQAQSDKLKTDVAALLDAAADEIVAAVAAAQNQTADPAVDALDTRVVTVTQNLKDTAAALRGGGDQPLPAPVTPGPSA